MLFLVQFILFFWPQKYCYSKIVKPSGYVYGCRIFASHRCYTHLRKKVQVAATAVHGFCDCYLFNRTISGWICSTSLELSVTFETFLSIIRPFLILPYSEKTSNLLNLIIGFFSTDSLASNVKIHFCKSLWKGLSQLITQLCIFSLKSNIL